MVEPPGTEKYGSRETGADKACCETEGKNGKSLAPVMMSLISSAHKKGITFSPEEMSFVLEILKDGKSKEEQAQIDRMVRMVSGYAKRAGK